MYLENKFKNIIWSKTSGLELLDSPPTLLILPQDSELNLSCTAGQKSFVLYFNQYSYLVIEKAESSI